MELGSNKTILRHFQLLLAVFAVVILTTGIIAYFLAAAELKNQLALKCQALAATVASVIAEDSDGYAAFLGNMDVDTEYYRRTKALMRKIKSVNVDHVQYIYTTWRVDGNTIMYVIGGEDPSSPVYTAPGVEDRVTKAESQAYDEQRGVMGGDFEETTYGRRLSAYEPIFHKETGEFLGMAGADIISEQYSGVMWIFGVQTVVSLIAGLAVFALATYWLSGKVTLIMDRQRFAAHEAEQKLAMENAALERVNRLKTDLMATISHEARTPLAVLASYAGLVSMKLKHKGADMETAADLDKIVSEAQRVAGLIDGMKKLTLDSRDTSMRERLDFGELIRQVVRLYQPLFARSGVDVHLHIEGECPVYGNSEELTQVVFNIMQNAREHTERGSVTVNAAREDGRIVITVSDTGTGIAPDLLPRIFEHGVKGANGGAGIGLAVCKEIMDSHNGTIAIASDIIGAAVTLTLPEFGEGDDHGA